MQHFENFSTYEKLSQIQSKLLDEIIAKMAETGSDDVVEWKKEPILTSEIEI